MNNEEISWFPITRTAERPETDKDGQRFMDEVAADIEAVGPIIKMRKWNARMNSKRRLIFRLIAFDGRAKQIEIVVVVVFCFCFYFLSASAPNEMRSRADGFNMDG